MEIGHTGTQQYAREQLARKVQIVYLKHKRVELSDI